MCHRLLSADTLSFHIAGKSSTLKDLSGATPQGALRLNHSQPPRSVGSQQGRVPTPLRVLKFWRGGSPVGLYAVAGKEDGVDGNRKPTSFPQPHSSRLLLWNANSIETLRLSGHVIRQG